MGRHARGARLQRVPVATIVLGGLIVAVIGVGSWVSVNTGSTQVADVGASAVVVSSPPCEAGGGRTVVDVLDIGAAETGGTTRASLDGCGYREGQVLAVQHAPGEPAVVAIAEATDAGTDLQPFGILAAALLAIAGALAVWFDGRAGRLFRRGRSIDLPDTLPDSTGPEVSPPSASAAMEYLSVSALDAPGQPSARSGRHARFDPTDTETDVGAIEDVMTAPGRGNRRDVGSDDASTTSDVDLVFAFGAELAVSLRDELFTHRGVPTA